MPPVCVCPDRDTLARFVLGHLPPATVEELIGHIEECEKCITSLRGLPTADTLIEAIRDQPTVADSSESGAIRSLLTRVLNDISLGGVSADESKTQRTEQEPVPPHPASLMERTPEHVPERVPAVGVTNPNSFDFLSPPESDEEIGRLGPYQIVGLLGAGGMGIVFRAKDTVLRRDVALKVINPRLATTPETRGRFLREARSVARLTHDNIVTIFGVGEENGVPYLAMQLLQGKSLEARLRESVPLTIRECLEYGRQLARGLAAAHTVGLIHRDIKPANLWLEPGPSPRVKVLDFGLARAIETEVDGAVTQISREGAIQGTPGVMSPEATRGLVLDERTDLFSLGVVLYRMSTGRAPFTGTDIISLYTSVAADTPPAPHVVNPGVPVELSEYIMQMLEKNREKRPSSAAEVEKRLTELLNESEKTVVTPSSAVAGVVLPPPEPTATLGSLPPSNSGTPAKPAEPPKPANRRKLAFALGALVMLPLLIFAVWKKFTAPEPTADPVPPIGTLVIKADSAKVEVTVRTPQRVVYEGKERSIKLQPGEYAVEFREKAPDGTTRVTTNPKVTITADVTTEVGFSDIPTPSSQRAIAEWFLSLGGHMAVAEENGDSSWITDSKKLPQGDIRITKLYVTDAVQKAKIADADLAKLSTLTDLREVHFDNCPGQRVTTSASILKQVKALPKLTTLDVEWANLDDQGLEYIVSMPALKNLKLMHGSFTRAGFNQLKKLKNLEVLSCRPTSLELTDDDMDVIEGLTNLRELHLDRNIAPATVNEKGLTKLTNLKNLTNLDLVGWSGITDDWLARLESFPNLTRLHLVDTSVTGEGLKHLRFVPKLIYLGYGTLGAKQKYDPAGLKNLPALKDLESANFFGVDVTEADLLALAQTSPNVTHLAFHDCRLKDDDLVHLSKFDKLNGLGLNGSTVTNAGAKKLEATAQTIAKVKGTVNLTGTKVTPQGLDELRKKAPGCTIYPVPQQ